MRAALTRTRWDIEGSDDGWRRRERRGGSGRCQATVSAIGGPYDGRVSEEPTQAELEAAFCWEAVDLLPGRPSTSSFRRRVRLHQARWRGAHGHPIGTEPIRPRPGVDARPVGSRLPLDYAQATGAQFVTPGALDGGPDAARDARARPELRSPADLGGPALGAGDGFQPVRGPRRRPCPRHAGAPRVGARRTWDRRRCPVRALARPARPAVAQQPAGVRRGLRPRPGRRHPRDRGGRRRVPRLAQARDPEAREPVADPEVADRPAPSRPARPRSSAARRRCASSGSSTCSCCRCSSTRAASGPGAGTSSSTRPATMTWPRGWSGTVGCSRTHTTFATITLEALLDAHVLPKVTTSAAPRAVPPG